MSHPEPIFVPPISHASMASQTHFYLSSPTAPPTQSAIKFASYINRNLEVGYATDGREANYVPPSKLREYWTRARIEQVLREHGLVLNAQAIRSDYLRIFSILVYIGAVVCLTDVFTEHERTDSKFPEERCPWSAAPPAYASLWPAFDEHQWKFFPLELRQRGLLGTVVAKKRILPWKRTILRQRTTTSTVYKIEIHPSCNQLLEDPQVRSLFASCLAYAALVFLVSLSCCPKRAGYAINRNIWSPPLSLDKNETDLFPSTSQDCPSTIPSC
jgi:hypothetical protein